ncbi:hypothetical protein QJS66_17340 [Kocuria rhizophila]|nr:hypothetical protein QJS66_17340 [Kocuria rhizophila]
MGQASTTTCRDRGRVRQRERPVRPEGLRQSTPSSTGRTAPPVQPRRGRRAAHQLRRGLTDSDIDKIGEDDGVGSWTPCTWSPPSTWSPPTAEKFKLSLARPGGGRLRLESGEVAERQGRSGLLGVEPAGPWIDQSAVGKTVKSPWATPWTGRG